MKKLSSVMKKNLSYNPKGKAAFHRTAKAALTELAKALGLREGEYDLRSNQGGSRYPVRSSSTAISCTFRFPRASWGPAARFCAGNAAAGTITRDSGTTSLPPACSTPRTSRCSPHGFSR